MTSVYNFDYHFTTEVKNYLEQYCNVHDFSKENEDKYLVSYNKSKYNFNENNVDTIGLHRSLIFLNGNLICYSPPKSFKFEKFCEKYPDITQNIIVEEFVEGTMINVFYNNISHNWEIATKNNIGGTNHFYKDSICSFGDIFYDTCQYIGFDLEEALNKNYCYSFVMKHPYNPMVEIITQPSLYLIEVYEIVHENLTNTIIQVKNRNEIAEQLSINWDIKVPRQFQCTSYNDLTFVKLFTTNDSYYIRRCITMGYVIKNTNTNERTKLRNPEYEYLHKLKGNQYDFFYQYLLLRQSKLVKEYLTYFPEHSSLINMYREMLHAFTDAVYKYYCLIHVKQMAHLSLIPQCYRKLIYNLHGEYISQKKTNPSFKITKKYVIDYINGLHPSIIFSCYNKSLSLNK